MSIFSEAEWGKMYEISNPAHFSNHSLHYFLAQGKPESFVCNFIGKNRLSPLLIKSDNDHFGLTPLMIAVMRCQQVTARTLLEAWRGTERARSIDVKDVFGFTALHHALLARLDPMVALLQEFGANGELLTNLEGSGTDLKKLSQKEIDSPSLQSIFIEEEPGIVTAINTLSRDRLQALTGLELYRDGIYVQANLYKQFWMTSFEGIPKNLGGWYGEDPKPQYPKLLAKHCKHIPGWELVAHEKIKSQTILGEYAGELFQEKTARDTSYALFSVDAKKMGNFTRWTNWGFPNCIITPCPKNGYMVGLLITTEEVPQGEPLLWDYGLSHPLAFEEPHFLFGKERMQCYFKQTDLQKCLELWVSSAQSAASEKLNLAIRKQAYHRNVDLQTKVSFVLNAPGALLDLHFNGIIKVTTWLELFEQNPEDAHPIMQDVHSTFAKWTLYRLMLLIKEFEEKMVSHATYKQEAAEWILTHIGKLSVLSLMQGMQLMLNEGVPLASLEERLLKSKPTMHSEETYQQIIRAIAHFHKKIFKENALRYLTVATQFLPDDTADHIKKIMPMALQHLKQMLKK